VKFKQLLFSLLLATLAGVLVITPALAFPPLPSSFYGQGQVNGQNAPDGTLGQALIDGAMYAAPEKIIT
jgi:hypothetical protein